jgi:hypothetical protein
MGGRWSSPPDGTVTGGASPERESNRNALRQNGVRVVWSRVYRQSIRAENIFVLAS